MFVAFDGMFAQALKANLVPDGTSSYGS